MEQNDWLEKKEDFFQGKQLLNTKLLRIKDGSKIVFIGDSITDCGRRDPQSEGLGVHGYVRIFSEMMTTREPQKKVEILNRGIGGNTVDDLRARWNEDVLI